MTLPRIPAARPRVRELVEEKTFEDMFIHSLRLYTADEALNQKLRVSLQYYDYDNKEIDSDTESIQTLRINDLMAEAARVPALAQMLVMVVTTLGLLHQESELVAMIARRSTPARLAALAAVRAELGIV